MFLLKLLVSLQILLNALGGHVPGREGKCEFSTENNPMLGNIYSCKIKNAVLNQYDKFTITGAHQSKGRKDLGVKFVEFSSSNITFIPEQVFRKFPNLLFLGVRSVGLKSFRPLLANSSSKLKVILANDNHISKLDTDAFLPATSLEILSFRKNEIAEINVNAFRNLRNLRELYLSDNKLITLHMNTFDPLISLEILAISGNLLQSIDLELFHANLQLQEILLYDNKITSVHPQAFTSLLNLFNLELHGNLCVDKDIRSDENEELKELIKSNLKVCFDGYPDESQ